MSKEAEKKKDDSFVVRIPRLSFKSGSLNLYLVFTLIIFAFLLGMLTNRVFTLEKQAKNPGNTATANNAAAEPTAPLAPPVVKDLSFGKLPLLGEDNAKVTIVEFSDFQCPFCKSYVDDTHKQLHDTYVKTGKVKFAYRHYPLTSIHPNAQKAAEAAECANEQDKFWDYHDVLFENQDTWSPLAQTDVIDTFTTYAGDLGMDTDQFRSCLDSNKYKKNIDDDLEAGQKAQVDGTPAFFINGTRVVGAVPFSELQATIDQELNK